MAALPDLDAADSRLPEDWFTALPLGDAVSLRVDLLSVALAGSRLVLSEDFTSFFSDSFEPAWLLVLLPLVWDIAVSASNTIAESKINLFMAAVFN